MRKLDQKVDAAYKLIASIDDATVGRLLKGHLQGTIYDLGYEGYAKHQIAGVKNYIYDLALAIDATVNNPGKLTY